MPPVANLINNAGWANTNAKGSTTTLLAQHVGFELPMNAAHGHISCLGIGFAESVLAPKQRSIMRTVRELFVLLAICGLFITEAAAQTAQRALFLSGDHTYQGFIYKPSGNGPFPAIVYNQAFMNSPKDGNQPFASLAKLFTSHGYVFFVVGRHPLVDAEGKKLEKQKLFKSHEMHGVIIASAMKWLATQIYVNEKRIFVIGDAAGGVSSMFIDRSAPKVCGMVLFSPGMLTLRDDPSTAKRLKQAAQELKAPAMLIQAENEFSLVSLEVIGSELKKKGGLNRLKLYPAYGGGPTDAQKFGVDGYPVWQKDVLEFLQEVQDQLNAKEESVGK